MLAHLVVSQRWLLVIGVVCSVGSGAASIAPAFISGALVNALQAGHFQAILPLALLILGATTLWGGFNAAEGYVISLASERFGQGLRTALYERLLRLPMSFFQSKTGGELINRTNGDVDVLVSAFERSIAPTMSAVIAFCITIGAMVHSNLPLTLVALVTVPLWSLVSKPAATHLNALQMEASKARDIFLAYSAEALDFNGAMLIKAHNAQDSERKHFSLTFAKIVALRARQALISRLVSAILMIIVGVGPALILTIGAYLVAHHFTSLGTLVAFLSLQGRLYSPVTQVAAARLQFAQVRAVRGRLVEICDAADEVDTGVILPKYYDLSVENLAIAIAGRNLFEPITFNVREGSFCALMGPSGIGKSSLIACLGRFLTPESGVIRIGGVSINAIPLAVLRDRVVIVAQHSAFFTRSLRENLTLGNSEVTDEDIYRALCVVGAADVLRTLPNGLDTIVGADAKFSGGEKQRFAIARALLRQPGLLVLDEATNALDATSEQHVLKALRSLQGTYAIIAITHRPEVASYADQVVEIFPQHLAVAW